LFFFCSNFQIEVKDLKVGDDTGDRANEKLSEELLELAKRHKDEALERVAEELVKEANRRLDGVSLKDILDALLTP
jgi:ribonuclease HI